MIEEIISKKICSACYDGSNNDDQTVILYGIQLVVESVFKMVVLLLLSAYMGRFWQCVQFCLVFCPLRAMAGGIHCKTNVGCTATFFGIYFLGILFDKLGIPFWMIVISFVVCLMVCLRWAPSSTENNPITDVKIRRRKKGISVLLLLFWFAEVKYTMFDFHQGYIVAAVVSLSVLVVVQEVLLLWRKKV